MTLTRLEIALQLMTRPADPVLTAVDALDIADALLAGDEKRSAATPTVASTDDVPPLPDGYRFGVNGGNVIDGGGAYATTRDAGFDAVAEKKAGWAAVRAESREHAERIVRAMIAAGRAVKP